MSGPIVSNVCEGHDVFYYALGVPCAAYVLIKDHEAI